MAGLKNRKSSYKRKYGITLGDYEEMLENQNGECATCHRQCSTGKNLAVDHCHYSGRVRGLLCARCNLALGLVNDSVHILLNLIDHIKK